jgi:phospholipid transport system transporter-binding protein
VSSEVLLSEGDRLRIAGSVTIHNVAAVVEQGVALFDRGGEIIDLSQVEDVDSSAVSMLLEWQREAARRRRRIDFVNMPEKLTSLVRLYDLFELIPQSSAREKMGSRIN